MHSGSEFEANLSSPVDISVIVVTYESAADLPGLIDDLRREVQGLRLRVIVVDNESSDGSHEVAAGYPDVVAVSSGGNLGYAGAINIGLQYVGLCSAYLILNPDLRLTRGSLAGLFARLATSSGIGAVVPKILDGDGQTYCSIRYEPTVRRAFGDALFGSRWPSRPAWLRETEFGLPLYEEARQIDWATGAAVLISSDAAERTGTWDERYFLYSEETDFLARVRSAGLSVWFEPDAVVTHRQGGSGTSAELSALLNVNRLRYFRKRHRYPASVLFWCACLLSSLLRTGKPDARRTLMYLSFIRRWSQLPQMQVGTRRPNEAARDVMDGELTSRQERVREQTMSGLAR